MSPLHKTILSLIKQEYTRINRAGERNAAAAFAKRYSHQLVSFNNELLLIGGQDVLRFNDVWSSSDGVNWAQLTASAAFSAREGHQMLSFNNLLWLFGGFDGIGKNDIWYSSDGITWTQQTASAVFSARDDHQVVTFNSKLWLIGGRDINGKRSNEVWSSIDGSEWRLGYRGTFKFK